MLKKGGAIVTLRGEGGRGGRRGRKKAGNKK